MYVYIYIYIYTHTVYTVPPRHVHEHELAVPEGLEHEQGRAGLLELGSDLDGHEEVRHGQGRAELDDGSAREGVRHVALRVRRLEVQDAVVPPLAVDQERRHPALPRGWRREAELALVLGGVLTHVDVGCRGARARAKHQVWPPRVPEGVPGLARRARSLEHLVRVGGVVAAPVYPGAGRRVAETPTCGARHTARGLAPGVAIAGRARASGVLDAQTRAEISARELREASESTQDAQHVHDLVAAADATAHGLSQSGCGRKAK